MNFSKIFNKKIVLIIVVLVGLGIFFKTRTTPSQTSIDYQMKRSDISEHIIISGNANDLGNAPVYSSSTGIVEEVLVKNGSVVSEGQELLKIKSSASEIEKAQALADYQSALANLNTAKQTKTNNQSILEAGRKTVIDASVAFTEMTDRRNTGRNNPLTGKPYTQDEIDSITSTLTSSRKSFEYLERKFLDSDTAITAAQSSVTANLLALQATQNSVIKAPISGTIMNLSVALGDMVNARDTTALSSTTNIPVLRISSSNEITVLIKLNEIDITKVKTGQKAMVIFDSIPDKSFDAKVSRIDDVGENSNAVVTYKAYVTLIEPDERIKTTMTATVTIETETKKNVLSIPNSALTKANGENQVILKKNGKSNSETVKTGIKNETTTEIISGLTEGDIIVIPKSK